jgi:hypothetical protein
MERVSARVRERSALPKSTRGGQRGTGATNYHGMSSEAFRTLMQQMKRRPPATAARPDCKQQEESTT